MISTQTHILKFGGTSLQDHTFIEQAAQIVTDRAKTARPVVVVSAIAGVTDALIKIADEQAFELIENLEQQHDDLFHKFVSLANGQQVILQTLFGELRKVTQNEAFRKENKPAWRDHILSVGERASALIFSGALSKHNLKTKPVNAHQFIKTDSNFGQAAVKSKLSRKLIRKQLQELKEIPVVTGFIGSDDQGRITTLGRSGSDYTAGLIADALNADHLEIWTDVDGLLTADPRWVPTAKSIEELNFDDIAELSAHGANVIHPKTIRPIEGKTTSVLVKNSRNPVHPGTLISSGFPSNGSLRTITVTGPFVWLQFEATHAFAVLNKLNELLGNRASEAVAFKYSSPFEPARFLIDQSLFSQIYKQLQEWTNIQSIGFNRRSDIYKVKKFSNHFTDEGLTSRIWRLLDAKNLQPLETERDHAKRFISFLFNHDEARRAARLFDDYLQNDKTVINLFITGTGAIGKTLLRQLQNIKPAGIEFRLLGICNSRKMLWYGQKTDEPFTPDWSKAKPTNWDLIVEKLIQPIHNLIFIDATGNPDIARLYPRLFKSGVHIVTPSKLANTFEQSFFDELRTQATNSNASFRYETTVGAGLPVISTIQDLQNSSDEIFEISGVVSGTMTYLFNQVKQGVPFSEAVVKARELGYAEPDPRDDLSGEDVARKFLTIARTLGLKIERDELQVESLIPNELLDADTKTFLNRLVEYDDTWTQRFKEAQKRNETLRYTGRLKNGKIAIGIQSVPVSSPLGQLKGTDNLVQIFSRFYNQTPLVIQGPGAGKEVTAAGVMADVLKVAERMG
ncbi:MAG TPA: aspartate kinase [Balneolaceae bacterium]